MERLSLKVAGTSNTNFYRATTSTYDALGRRIAVQEHTPLPKDYGEMEDRVRFFAYDAGAGILTRRDGTLDDDNHFDPGSTALEKGRNVHHYTYVNGQSVAHLTEAGELDVTSRLTAYDTQAGTGAAVVQENDTLQRIAQRVYGDAGLWYVLAEANAIQDNDDLVVGMTLRTPAVKTVSNTASTYQPYDPAQVIGPTTPDLPWITPPPKAGCDVVGIILMAVVAAVVLSFAPEIAGALGEMFPALAGVAATAGGYFAAGVLASTASQVVGKAIGAVDHFSLRSAVGEGIANVITFGMSNWGKVAAGAGKFMRASLRAIGNAAASTIGNKIAGVEDASFSWRSVAASVVSSAITKGITNKLGFGGENLSPQRAFGEQLAIGAIGGVVSTHVRRKFGFDDEINYGATFADAFGHALGNAIGQGIRADIHGSEPRVGPEPQIDVGPVVPASGAVTTSAQQVSIDSTIPAQASASGTSAVPTRSATRPAYSGAQTPSPVDDAPVLDDVIVRANPYDYSPEEWADFWALSTGFRRQNRGESLGHWRRDANDWQQVQSAALTPDYNQKAANATRAVFASNGKHFTSSGAANPFANEDARTFANRHNWEDAKSAWRTSLGMGQGVVNMLSEMGQMGAYEMTRNFHAPMALGASLVLGRPVSTEFDPWVPFSDPVAPDQAVGRKIGPWVASALPVGEALEVANLVRAEFNALCMGRSSVPNLLYADLAVGTTVETPLFSGTVAAPKPMNLGSPVLAEMEATPFSGLPKVADTAPLGGRSIESSLRRITEIRKALNVSNGRNIAFAEFEINGNIGEMIATSGKHPFPGTVSAPSVPKFNYIATGNNARLLDSEAKIFENFAAQYPRDATGIIRLFSERPLCVSCSGIVPQFQEMFPGVRVIVSSGPGR